MNKNLKDLNPEFQMTIQELDWNANGIGFHENRKIRVEKTLPGELVELKYNPALPHKSRIELYRIIKSSPRRATPPCSYFSECGGCQIQHLSYRDQLDLKLNLLKEQLSLHRELKKITVQPVSGMSNPYYYRNKCQIPFQLVKNQVIYGLYRKGTHQIIPFDRCIVENKETNHILALIKEWSTENSVSPYDEINREGLLRYVVIRKGEFTRQIMVILVITQPTLPHVADLLKILQKNVTGLTSLVINHNPRTGNIILGNQNEVIWGSPYIEEKFLNMRFRIYPNTFFQVNSIQALKMIQKMQELLNCKNSESILDLYCGIGVMALVLTPRVKKVIGIDLNANSIAAAQENVSLNRIKNALFLVANLQKGLKNSLPADFNPEIVLIDPPRKGITDPLIKEITELKPSRVVYISCNPQTLVNDLLLFSQSQYGTDEIFPFDLFPQTAHLENLVILQKK